MYTYVTGCAGFIGSHLCDYLLQHNHAVVGIDNLSTGSNLKNLEEARFCNSFYFEESDTRDQVRLREILNLFPPETVIHCAAASHVDRSLTDPIDFMDNNVVGTTTLFTELLNYSSVRTVINFASDEIYGPTNHKVSEGSILAPTSPYAASKAAQYLVGHSFHKTYNLPVITVCPTNTYGPRQYPEKIIPKFTRILLAGQKVPLMKSTYFTRDWLAVDDHIRAILTIIERGAIGEDYNIAGDNIVSNYYLTKQILSILNLSEDMIEIVPDRLSHDSSYLINDNKIRQLGWSPQKEFLPYLKQTVEWYVKSPGY